jgi:DNA-directed RNA polymerase specialized sigma24 family protein
VPDQSPDFTMLIEERDFLDVHLPRLSEKQQRTLVAWSEGKTCRDIAAEEGITAASVHNRLSSGIRRLREFAFTWT